MRKLLGAATVLAVAAMPVFAQTTPPGPPAPTVAGPTVPGTVLVPGNVDSASMPPRSKVVPGAPLAGANSFTESQAKARIEAHGFTSVTGLKKDDQSIWRGQAMKDGKLVSVALDFQGNVVAD